MVISLDFESKSTMLPPISIPIHISQYDIESTNALGDIILDLEQEILKLEVPDDNMNGNYDKRPDNWITGRLSYYNFFDESNPEIAKFKRMIYNSYLEYQNSLGNPIFPAYIHGWANIIRTGEQITPHNHAGAHVLADELYSYISGNFCVRADNTSTNYRSPYSHKIWKHVKNLAGDLVLFPSFIFHNTSVNQAIEPRLSLAFDIITEEVYNTLPDNFKKIFCRLEP